MTELRHFVVGPVSTNCYFLVNKETGEALVVDPGASSKALWEELSKEDFTPVGILLTHGHFDHADGVEEFSSIYQERFGKDLFVGTSELEKETLRDFSLNLSQMFTGESKSYEANYFFRDQEEMELGGMKFRVLSTPGHTAGGCCYYFPGEGLVFSGDTLFCGSVGRTDFPGGSMSTIVQSIREKLLVLPDHTKVLPGHDSMSTIENEKRMNPYCAML